MSTQRQVIVKHLSRDKLPWRCNPVAKEQLGTRRRFEQFESFSSFNLYFLLYLIMSYSTNTKGVLFCSTRFMVYSGTGFLYQAVNRQGTIVCSLCLYAAGRLPRSFPASFRRWSSLNTTVPTCGNNIRTIKYLRIRMCACMSI